MASPSTISGLQVWIDPNNPSSYILSSESTLTTITDTVGSVSYTGNAFIQSNAFGSRSALSFFGNESLINSTYSFPNSSYSIFVVAKLFSTSSSFRQVFAADTPSTLSFGSINDTLLIQNGSNNIWNVESNLPYRSVNSIWRIIQLEFDGTSSITRVNSLSQQSFSGQTQSFTSTSIGGFTNSFWNGYIGDILIYNRPLNSSERDTVLSYLNSAWNFQPPSAPQIIIRPHAVPNELRFWWYPPLNVGSGILSYSLDAPDSQISIQTSSSTRIYSINNLSNGSNYQFSLTATNESGDGPSASFRSVQPGSKPSSLTSVSYSLIPPNAMIVRWKQPVNDPSIIRNVVSVHPMDSNENILPQLSTTVSYGTTYNNVDERLIYFPNVNCNYKFIARQVNDPGWSPNNPYEYVRVSLPTFSPSSFSQNQLWLETLSLKSFTLSNESTVTSLIDQSPNQFIFNSNAYSLPFLPQFSNSVNSIGTVSFPNSQEGLSQISTLSSITNLFWVGKQGTYATRNGLLGHPNNRYWDGASNHYILSGISPSGITDASATLYLTQEIPISNLFSNILLSPTDRTFLLHVQDISGPTDFTGICFSSNVSNGTVGWRGEFCEAMTFTSTLTTEEISTITSYLTKKWGLYQQPSFTPISLPGLFLWLDASSPSFYDLSGGTDIIRIKDRSFNNYDMYIPHPRDSNGTPTFFWPTLGEPINGISTISFQNNFTALKQPREIDGVKHMFWVGRQNSSNTEPTLFGHSNFQDWQSFQNFFISDSAAAPGIKNAPGIRYVNSGDYLFRSTCSFIPIPPNNEVFLLSLNNITGNTRFNGICYDLNDAHGWQGDFAECLCYNQTLTSEQQQQVETYLRLKWNIYS